MGECSIAVESVDVWYPSRLYNTLSLKEHVFSLLRLQRPRKLLHDIHALRAISLTIRQGERVGIIGRNGAGKSTLLRLIGGVYPAQRGTVRVSGNIRSLFEMSLGFELGATGRQNIMYRGLLQGELPDAIKRKEQEIIEFAGIGEFIDYPVKTYSAGMMVRLAFAISTCSSGEVLLLDEVVGAGDAFFLDKARERIRDLIANSSILVLVSHDLASIRGLCSRVIHMDQGAIVQDGPPDAVIAGYLASANGSSKS